MISAHTTHTQHTNTNIQVEMRQLWALLVALVAALAVLSAVGSSNVEARAAVNVVDPARKINSTLPELLEYGFVETDIASHDGVVLKSIYFNPTATTGAKNPTVIFISSWGMNKWEYVVPAKDLADRGYTVVSYTGKLKSALWNT
jgi:hypothetical protein